VANTHHSPPAAHPSLPLAFQAISFLAQAKLGKFALPKTEHLCYNMGVSTHGPEGIGSEGVPNRI